MGVFLYYQLPWTKYSKYIESASIAGSIDSFQSNIFNGCYDLNRIMVYNKSCDISKLEFSNKHLKIYSYSDSKAYDYAKKSEYDFVPIDKTHVHEFDDNFETISATCTKDGYIAYTCKLCKDTVTQKLAARGHDFDDGVVTRNAACGTEGIKTFTCTECGTTETESIPALLHELNEKVVLQQTCSNVGLKQIYCINCSYSRTEEAEMLEHTFITSFVKATTTKDGYKIVVCKDCNYKENETIISKANKITMGNTERAYNGKTFKPVLTVKNSKNIKLIPNKDYTVKVTNQAGKKVNNPVNVGKYNYIVTFKGNYSGTVKKAFTIKPKATEITKLQSKAKKRLTIKWRKVPAQITGYEIKFSTTAKFKAGTNKTVVVKNTKAISKVLTTQKSNKKYFIQIRTYKLVNGVKMYSAWSKTKSIKVK